MGDQVSLARAGVPQTLTSVAGYGETITVPHNNASGGSATVSSSLSLPSGVAGVPASFGVQTAMLYISITPSNTVTFSGSPSFSIVAPPSVQFNGAAVNFAYFDPAAGWQSLSIGSISGQTITMASASGNFTMQAGRTYVVFAYSREAILGCPTPTPTAAPSPTPTSTFVKPSPSPTPTSKPTPTPTSKPTSKPTPTPTPTATPTPSGGGSTACTAPGSTVPGNYLSIFTEGNISGSTYTQVDGQYIVDRYLMPTPTPPPTPTPTPVSVPTPSSSPGPTPTPFTLTIYYGQYTWPAFGGVSPFTLGAYSVPLGSGCFEMLMQQSGIALAHRGSEHRYSMPSTPNTSGFGQPKPPVVPFTVQLLDEGPLTSATISGITSSSGSGTYSFSTSTQAVNGTITITGSQTFTGPSADAVLREWASIKRRAEQARSRPRR